MVVEPSRRSRALPLVPIALAVLGIEAILSLLAIRQIAAFRLPDPDDLLRLVQVRDLLAGQAWFDLVQHRLESANGGVPMHWSRLVDLPLALVVFVLTPLIGTSAAEGVAALLVPLVCLALVVGLVCRLSWHRFGREEMVFSAIALGVNVPLMQQLQPLRIDHHGWQLVMVMAAVSAMFASDRRKGSALAGCAMAAGVTISIELLPMAVAIGAILALRWLRDSRNADWLIGYTASLALASGALLFATRGLPGVATLCDQLSPLHIALLGGAAAGFAMLRRLRPPVPVLAGLMTLTGLAGAIAYALAAPHCLSSGYGQIDPVVQKVWLDNVLEGRPLWRQPFDTALLALIPALFGLAACVRLAVRDDTEQRWTWIEYALLLVASLLVALLVQRAAAVTGMLAALPLGWQLARWRKALAGAPNRRRRYAALAGLCFVLAPPLPAVAARLVLPVEGEADGVPAMAMLRASDCGTDQDYRRLDALPASTVFAPVDIAPSLLSETHHAAVASGHHRAERGIRDTIEAFSNPPEVARGILARHRVHYVAWCPGLMEGEVYRQRGPGGLADRLALGDAPGWLEPVPGFERGALRVWRVR